MFYYLLALCFACFALHSLIHWLEHEKSKLVEGKWPHRVISIAMFVGWATWFYLVASDPLALSIPDWLAYSGLGLALLGALFCVLAALGLKNAKGKLVTTGVYSKFRHPLHVGMVLSFVGFPLFFHALTMLVFAVFLSANVAFWQYLEEPELEAKFKDYAEYKKSTWM